MSEQISTWKLKGEASSGRHLTGKRHSRRIQPRSFLSLLRYLSAHSPLPLLSVSSEGLCVASEYGTYKKKKNYYKVSAKRKSINSILFIRNVLICDNINLRYKFVDESHADVKLQILKRKNNSQRATECNKRLAKIYRKWQRNTWLHI